MGVFSVNTIAYVEAIGNTSREMKISTRSTGLVLFFHEFCASYVPCFNIDSRRLQFKSVRCSFAVWDAWREMASVLYWCSSTINMSVK